MDEFNQQSKTEFERIRDFIILHYKITERDDSAFWRFCKGMDIPSSLKKKIELFKTSGKLVREDDELFAEVAWQQVMIGQGLIAEDHHPLTNALSDEQLNELFSNLKTLINSTVEQLPSHSQFLEKVQN